MAPAPHNALYVQNETGLLKTISDEIFDLWQKGELCDLVFRSQDGVEFKVHRLIVSAASKPLSVLVSGRFAEGQPGQPIALDVPSSALRLGLQYIYGRPLTIQVVDIPPVLHFAHIYSIHGLAENIMKSAAKRLEAKLALQLLEACEKLGFDEYEALFEQHIACHFEEARSHENFVRISAFQLGRILKRDDLRIINEEAVLQAVVRWHGKDPERDLPMGLLIQHVRFPLLSLPSLRAADTYAQSIGPSGICLEREVRRAIKRHQDGVVGDAACAAKRTCLPYWWPNLGSSVPGGVVVASMIDPGSVAVRGGAVFVAGDGQVTRWPHGDAPDHVVAGQGARINGINCSGRPLRIAFDMRGKLLVTDFERNRLLRFDGDGAEIVGEGQWQLEQPRNVCCTASGAIYVLDGEEEQRIQKLHEGRSQIVVDCRTLPEDGTFSADYFFVAEDDSIYITDHVEHQILCFRPGCTRGQVVAGGHGPGSGPHQFEDPGGLHVTADKSIYVADSGNNRIMKWREGAAVGIVVAGGNGPGICPHQLLGPWDITADGEDAEVLYVAEYQGGRVTRWGPPPVAFEY